MIQKSTTRLKFKLPIRVMDSDTGLSTLSELNISFVQDDKVVLTKYLGDCMLADNVVVTWLSDEETMRFNNGFVSIQIDGKTKNDGNSFVTKPKRLPVGRLLKGRR